INIVSFTYVNREVTPKIKLPIAFELVRKDTEVTKMVKDKRSGKFKEKTTRQASIGKNELLRSRLKILTHQNNVKYSHVTFDSWYSSAENINFIVQDLKKQVVCALKDNRGISFDLEDCSDKKREWVAVSKAEIEPNAPIKIRLKKVPFELILIKRVFHNMNGTVGVQYLVGSDTDLDDTSISTIYKDRWSSEEVHRSLKQNTALEKMPAKLERSQANHIFASMIALVKLECMKLVTKDNHYTLKRNILTKALKQAWLEIKKLKEHCPKNSSCFPNFQTA
ncbi:MAG: transposase, partial [Cyanobacteria bacterium J06649_11]